MKTAIEVDERNFEREVLNSKQPFLLGFGAESYKNVAPLMEEIASEFKGRLKVGKVEAAKNPSLAKLCFIETLPTMLYFADGLVRDRIVGVEDLDAIVSKLERLLTTSWGFLSLRGGGGTG